MNNVAGSGHPSREPAATAATTWPAQLRDRLCFCSSSWCSFYQHVPTGCEWQWGLVWGHAVSEDLAQWRHLPPALAPTPGWLDCDGCWSGCCAVSAEGVPTILYTGVRLRSNRKCGPLPPPDQDSGLPFIESQCAAVPEDLDDDLLLTWRKLDAPAVALMPPGPRLTGWRDPFVYYGARSAAGSMPSQAQAVQRAVAQQAAAHGYRMLLGSGVGGAGGALLAYSCGVPPGAGAGGRASQANGGVLRDPGTEANGSMPCSSLAAGWRYEGPVCSVAELLEAAAGQDSPEARAAFELGEVWECPLLAQLPRQQSGSEDGGSLPGRGNAAGGCDAPWLLAVSPYPVKPPSSPSNPVLYWVGRMNEDMTRFDIKAASGPFRLDHGDVLYAPNVCTDAQGRLLLWAWLQERRPPGTAATYAGCLTLPRVLSLSPDGCRLVQQPVPEVTLLRRCFAAHDDQTPAAECITDGGVQPAYTSSAPAGAHGAVAPGFSGQGGWYGEDVAVAEGQLLPLEGVAGPAMDIELALGRGDAAAAGLLLLSHQAGSQGNALLTYTWDTNALEVKFGVPPPRVPSEALNGDGPSKDWHLSAGSTAAGLQGHLPPPIAATSPRKAADGSGTAAAFDIGAAPGSPAAFSVAAAAQAVPQLQLAELAEPLPQAVALEASAAEGAVAAAGVTTRHLGGPLTAPATDAEGCVRLRVLLDGSAVEVFTSSGEVLSTRVYRGQPPAGSGCGVCLVSLGGTAVLKSGAAWDLMSCWQDEEGGVGVPAEDRLADM